jgi:hypothetical protein
MRANIRFYHILESIQYGILYMIASFLGGVSLDFSFPHFTEDIETWELFRQTAFQCILLILVVYFTRYIIKKVPLLFPVKVGSSYIPYTTPEFNGEMMMGLIFLGSQLNLIQKIDLLAKRLYNYLYTEERGAKDGKVRLQSKLQQKVQENKINNN